MHIKNFQLERTNKVFQSFKEEGGKNLVSFFFLGVLFVVVVIVVCSTMDTTRTRTCSMVEKIKDTCS